MRALSRFIALLAGVAAILGITMRDFVSNSPKVLEFSLSPADVIEGEQASLRWRVEGAERVVIEPGIGSVLATTGVRRVTATSGAIYTLVATRADETAERTLEVITRPQPTPTIRLDVMPPRQYRGEPVTLAWTTADANRVVISDIGEVSASGSKVLTAADSRVFEAVASNSFGRSSTAHTELVVVEWPQPTLAVEISPNPVVVGRAARVSWRSENAKEVVIDGLGNVEPAGTRDLVILNPRTLRAEARSPGGVHAVDVHIRTVPLVSVVLPARHEVRVRLTERIGSGINAPEDEFRGQLERDIRVHDVVVARAHAPVWGRIVAIGEPGRVRGQAFVELHLEKITLVDGSVATIETTIEKRSRSSVWRDVMVTAAGAVIGATVGGARGAAAGAGAGVGAAAATRGANVVLVEGVQLAFRTRSTQRFELPDVR